MLFRSEVHDFLLKHGVDSLDAWDPEAQSYVDLASLQPDYLFTTTPYDIYLPEQYQSGQLIRLGKLCHVDYGARLVESTGEYASLYKTDYYQNASFFFNCFDRPLCEGENFVPLGYLKLDEYLYYGRPTAHPEKWKDSKPFKIIWKPRWTMTKGESTLSPFLHDFYGFLASRPQVELIMLSHPIMEKSLEQKGYLDYYQENIAKLKQLPNFRTEEGEDFLDTVLSADVMVADVTSTAAEFVITGKPLIHTTPDISLSPGGKHVFRYAYTAKEFSELEARLDALMEGDDPLKREREAAKDTYFFTPPKGKSVAQYLLQLLKDDFFDPFSGRQHFRKVISTLQQEQQSRLAALSAQLTEEKNTAAALQAALTQSQEEAAALQKTCSELSAKINRIPKIFRKAYKFLKR